MAKGRAWLCVLPVALVALDAGLTLAGQPDEYWRGARHLASELNPPARWALHRHPLLFAVGAAAWAGLVAALVLLLPRGLARAAALAAVCGHTVGAASWLATEGPAGWGLAALLFALAYRLLGWTWGREGRAALSRAGSVRFLRDHPEHVGDALAQLALPPQLQPAVGVPEAVNQRNGQGR